jgi:uncharacterized protein GlcG (DUF336 family)
MPLTLERAERMIEAARRKAEEDGARMGLVVLDADGRLIAQRRMDGCMFHMPEMAYNKAFTAVSFLRRSEEGASSPFFSRGPVISAGRVATLLGGVLLKDGDTVIGAFGVAGGTDPQNSACMDAALAAL